MQPAPFDRTASENAHALRLACVLAIAYLLIVAYASLQPFRDWRIPPGETLSFVFAPWPRYITFVDVFINIVAYVPMGLLLAAGLRLWLPPLQAVLAATLAAAAFSLAMECLQVFLPARIASNIDLLTNGTGGLVGALAAPLFSPRRLLGERLLAWRHRRFEEGIVADVGLLVVCLWIVTQFHPTAQLFGSGNLRSTFDFPSYTFHTPSRLLSAEALVVFFNFSAIALLLSLLIRRTRPRMLMIAAVTGLALGVKAMAAYVLFGAPHPFTWLTPGVMVGLVAGAALAYPLAHLPRPACLAGAALCIMAAVATINLAPDNPYQNLPQVFARGHTHLLSISGIVRAISELWPALAMGFLAAAAGTAERADARNRHRNPL